MIIMVKKSMGTQTKTPQTFLFLWPDTTKSCLTNLLRSIQVHCAIEKKFYENVILEFDFKFWFCIWDCGGGVESRGTYLPSLVPGKYHRTILTQTYSSIVRQVIWKKLHSDLNCLTNFYRPVICLKYGV